MKHGQDRGSTINPLEPEGNIYQHAPQRIEGNVDGLPPQLRAYFGPDNFDVANGKGTQSIIILDGGENGGCYSFNFGESVELREHAVRFFAVAIGKNFCGELLIAIARVGGEKQRIALGQESCQRGRSGGVEIGLAAADGAKSLIERV